MSNIYLCLILVGIVGTITAQTQVDGDIRLTGGNVSSSGTLEVFYKGSWGGVCDNLFSNNTPIVACRQLGFPSSLPSFTINVDGLTTYHLGNVRCHGGEKDLLSCQHNPWGVTSCSSGHGQNIALHCADDPCASNPCSTGSMCKQILDSKFTCTCRPGFNGMLCETDINECLVNNGGCSHDCVNTVGSYRCQCPGNYLQVGADYHTCYVRGLHVTCTSEYMTVTFDKNHFRGMHARYLTLRDRSCGFTENESQVKGMVPLEGCGTTVKNEGGSFVYENQVLSHTVPLNGLVTRVRDVNVTVGCSYDVIAKSENFYVVDNGQLHFTDHNQGNYSISMNLIHNGAVYHPNNSLPLEVKPGEKLSIKLNLRTNDSHLQVFARDCKAIPTSASSSQQLLVLNGCSVESNLTLKNVSNTEEILSLETFKFLGNSSTLFLHCEVLVCNISDPESRCRQGCLSSGGKGKRDVEGAYLSSHTLAVGPIQLAEKEEESFERAKKSELPDVTAPNSEKWPSILGASLALLGVSLIMITILLSIVVKKDDEECDLIEDGAEESLLQSTE